MRDCNGEVKVVWAKADIGADCNVISTTLLDKLRKDPSNATTTDPSLEDHRRDQSTFVVQGGLGLSLPTKPITEDGVRTFANKQAAFTETVELEFEAGHRRFNVVFCVLNTKEAESEADPKVNDKANANDMPHLLLGRPWLLGNHVLSFDISFLQTPVDFPHVLEPPTDDAVAEKLSRLHHSSSKYSPRGQNSARDRHTPQDFHKIGMQWPEWAEIDPWNLAYPLSLMIAGVYALIVLLS